MRTLFVKLRDSGAMLTALSAVVALCHGGLALLYVIGRAAPAIDPRPPVGRMVPIVEGWWWITVHLASGLALLVAAAMNHWRTGVWAGFASASAWASWAILVGIWSWYTVPPVSLTAPLLASGLALIGGLIGAAWSERDM